MTQEQHALGISSSSFGNNSKGGDCCGGGGGDDGNNNNNGGGGGGGGGGSGCSNNKPPTKNANNKPKKIPQRGLGVAQLEKMRLEEERKGEAAESLSGDFRELPNIPTSRLTVEREDVLRLNHAPNSFHFPSKHPNASFPSEYHHPHFAGSQMPNHGNGTWSRFRSGDYNHEADTTNQLFRFSVMPHETSVPVLSYPGVPPRPNPLTNATANISLGISPESALNLHIEPPSNQSFRGSSYSSSFTAEDKMIGTKRPYPFGQETSSTPYFSRHFRPSFAAPRPSSVELTLGHRGHATSHVEPRNKYFREGQSSSRPLPELNPIEDTKMIGDFLTLVPPNVSLPPVESKGKIVIDYSDRRTHDVSASASLSQEHTRGQMHNQQGPSRSTARPFSFFSDESKENQSTSDVRNEDEENGDTIDLNLKL